MDRKKSFAICTAALLSISCLCILVFLNTGLLSSGFNVFINDHLMITMYYDVQETGLWATITKWVIVDYNTGRFQPFYYIQDVLLTQILGINADLWFGYTCLLTILTTFFLFCFAYLAGLSWVIASLFPALALIGPQAIMWAQPSYPQVVGTFLLAIAMLLAVVPVSVEDSKLNLFLNALFVLFTLLLSLSKESYIIFVPALIAIRIWTYSSVKKVSLLKAIVASLKTNSVIAGIMLAELLYIFLVIGADGMGYAGIQEETFQVGRIIITTQTFLENSHLEVFAIAFVASVIILLSQRKSLSEYFLQLLPAVLIFLSIVSPQILLYSKSGIQGYYLIPATFGSALLVIYALHLLSQQAKLAAYMLVGLSLFWVFSDLPSVWTSYSQTARDNANINGLLQQTQTCTPDREPILVALNPRVRYEVSVALYRYIDNVYDNQNLVLATYGLEGTDFFSDKLKDAETFWSFLNPQVVVDAYAGKTIGTFQSKQDIDAIVVFDNLDEEFFATSRDWFEEEKFEQFEFPISFAPARLYCKRF